MDDLLLHVIEVFRFNDPAWIAPLQIDEDVYRPNRNGCAPAEINFSSGRVCDEQTDLFKYFRRVNRWHKVRCAAVIGRHPQQPSRYLAAPAASRPSDQRRL